MALRDKLRSNAAPLLQPGETIQSAFCAQTVSAYFALISIWIIIASNAYRAVIVTDRRILVCHSGRFTMSPVKAVIAEFPRETRLGEPDGLWWPMTALGTKLYVHRRFHKDVRQADATLPVG
jgi:hypothetical protein